MFKSLIKAIERLSIAQEEANKLNKEFMNYRYAKDKEAEQHAKETEQYTKEINEQSLRQNEEMMKLLKNNLQTALDKNNEMMTKYIDQRLGVNTTEDTPNTVKHNDSPW